MQRLRRPNPRFSFESSPDMSSPDHQRIVALEASIRAIRPSRVSSAPPPPLDAEGAKRLVMTLAELAVRQAHLGDTSSARRTVGDATLAIDNNTVDPATLGMASVLIGEALLVCDAPHYARERFATAVDICDGLGDRRWTVRAKVGLGRALVMLDDAHGAEMLKSLRNAVLDNAQMLSLVDASIKKAEVLFDGPQSATTGYGRPISFFPPSL